MTARVLFLMLVLATVGCRKKREAPANPDASSPVAILPAVPIEKFVAARTRGGNTEMAAVARDKTVLLQTLDGELRPIARDVLAHDVEATEGTEINLIGDGLVVLVAKISGTPGAYLLRRNTAPVLMTRDRCTTHDGVAWVLREGANARVRLVRGGGEATTPSIAVSPEGELHVVCGPDAIVLSVRDGEHLMLTSIGVDQLASPPALVEVEKEKELDDELRERVILPRKGRAVVILRVGEASVSVRELDEGGAGAWRKVTKLSLNEDADLMEAAAAPDPRGRIFFLVSEPASGSCGDGDPPRRIVLHDLDAKGEAIVASSRPVIELPCGVEAIAAHLQAEGTRATMWWTEPVDAKTCAHQGMSASAIVTATSDKPGARRAPILAEGIARADENRFLAVVRAGGCAPWAAPGNGTITLAPTAK